MTTELLEANFSTDRDAAGEAVFRASKVIKTGGVVAFPTETVYGLGADAMNPKAIEKIYSVKGRPKEKGLIIHISATDQMKELAQTIPNEAYALAGRFWPGPLTIILKKKDSVPDITTGGLPTVAMRMPDHETALELISTSGRMIAAPSANISGQPSPKDARTVMETLSGSIPIVLDSGRTTVGKESTIVDLSEGEIRFLRLGAISREQILRAVTPEAPAADKQFLGNGAKRVIFVDNNGITRAPMAAALFERNQNSEIEVLCRGITVNFPEPLNQKTEAVMISNGITLENFTSQKLDESDFSAGTYVFTMEERDRKKIIKTYKNASEDNTFLLSSFVGDELEIMDPYGGTLQTYGICFEVIRNSIEKLIASTA